jgi:hypothetical protein
MPNPHHRKKHKHFQPPPHKEQTRKGGGAKSIMAITGAVIGLMIAWFATEGNFVWIGMGLAAGAIIGYSIGRSMDSDKK